MRWLVLGTVGGAIVGVIAMAAAVGAMIAFTIWLMFEGLKATVAIAAWLLRAWLRRRSASGEIPPPPSEPSY